ncbi:MAG: UDP-N-acetylmuramoyl-L-alanyl-D-glutamate--2,6-diaminopimelate ligase [Gammaproteobacteria bacterium]|nr:UDP-N-acetylmuramoyl-L-alanyl-D-glutamate--2,6-diaminopimelate ligase [Gammaproteobacteria bacterium]
MSASLRQLLDGLVVVPERLERSIDGITMDSRRVQPGGLFLACAGSRSHGASFIEEAVHRGARAIVVETEGQPRIDAIQLPAGEVPVLGIPELRRQAGLIGARFYGEPSRHMPVIGVTGTNGKTSVSQFIAHALAVDAPAGVIGTLGNGLVSQLESTGHTTPDAVSVQATLADLLAAGARAVVMEVSSHGLDQGRVNGVQFEVAVFTNLTHEHLDYHGDMASYAAAKRLLFQVPDLRAAALNLDDAVGREWHAQLAGKLRVLGFGLDASFAPEVSARDLRLGPEGIAFEAVTPTGVAHIESPLIGRFNASNLLAALSVLLLLGMAPDVAAERLSRLRAVPGRMERFGGGAGRPMAVVDYAHTPDALEQVLMAARAHTRGRLVCVFGCGGDRDRGKRPIMGKVAERLADQVVVTDDNPRSEDPEFIVEEITRGMTHPERAQLIRDRARAIHAALAQAGPDDVVLVAGKGHETEQHIGDRKLLFSDRVEVSRFFGEEVLHG